MHWVISSTKEFIRVCRNQLINFIARSLMPIVNVKIILLVTTIIGVICYLLAYILKDSVLQPPTRRSVVVRRNRNLNLSNQISVTNFPPPYESNFKLQTIFMIEATEKPFLTRRQACAVESAARANPSKVVILCLTSRIVNRNNPQMSALFQIHNVQIVTLNISMFFSGSPFGSWYLRGDWKKAKHGLANVKDALRFLTIYRFGGICLDLDMIVIKSIDNLYNCVGMANEDTVGLGLMAFKSHHSLIKRTMTSFVENYKPSKSSSIASKLVTKILKRKCSKDNVIYSMDKFCKDIRVLPSVAFYPIPKWDWFRIFKSSNKSSLNELLSKSYAVKMWNELGYKRRVVIGFGQMYEHIAREYCPIIYNSSVMSGMF